ncbi:UFSP2 [Mytilus edulis]|uniref:UFSP2 n=1 Tax=Mytilus edulis TaxID=6550 RepID=A0A8S3UD71_MYTED|nr:UFSP2 [Mytilus edulis]
MLAICTITNEPVNTKSVDLTLHIDTISTVKTDTTVSKLAVAVSTSVCLEKRRDLHKKFCLNDDSPIFRRNNKHMLFEDLEKYGYLVNPHAGLSPSGVKYGTPYIIQGLYSYHHYMQDRFDDNKWGCAYRSLQTLISWFRLQGYTEKPIPGHKEMQQVTSKIMFVSAGADLSSKGRELAQHFTTQGTPIMIGGGVLAHTILGVDFNDVTGDLKF